MAILDYELILSKEQAVTTMTANASTNVIDFGSAGAGYDKKVFATVNTLATSTGSATVTVSVQTDIDDGFTAATTLFSTSAIAVASLVAGYKMMEFTLPAEVKQYVRVVYTVATAALNAGKFNAWIDDAQQTNMIIF